MTHPIPLEQLSSHQIFNEENTEIRIISYFEENVSLQIEGDIQGIMKYCRRLPNGATLYSYPLKVSKGQYHIRVTGHGCNISRHFFIGDQYQGEKEAAVCYQRGLLFLKFSSIPLFFTLFVMIFPILSNRSLGADKAESWIYGENSRTHLFYIIFLSPFVVRYRVICLPKSIRYLFLFSLIYPLIFPIHIFKPIHGLHGWSFSCFTLIGTTVYYDEWALQMTMFFYLVVLAPSVLLAGSSKLYFLKHWIYKLHIIISIITCIGINVVNYRWVGESVTIPNLFINPTFVIFPTILYISIYFIINKGGHHSLNLIEPLPNFN